MQIPSPVLSRLVAGAALTLAGLCCLSHAAAAAPVAGAYLIDGVRVFDGERFYDRRSVYIAGGKIVSADFHGAPPSGATLVKGGGRTLMPGLIDAHVHAYQYLDLPLLFGVTTQIDMFTSVAVMQDVRGKMARGDNTQAADLVSAGILATAPHGHGTEFGIAIPTLNKPEQAQAFVDARIAEGSSFIKIVMESGGPSGSVATLDLATVTALIDAAHRRGKLAVVHIGTLRDARAALAAGADGLAHLFFGPAPTPAELDSFVALARDKHAFVIATASVMQSAAGVAPRGLALDPRVAAYLNKAQLQSLTINASAPARPQMVAGLQPAIAALYRAHVPLLAGTDAGNPGTQYGATLHQELAALVAAGVSAQDALAAATSLPAKAFGLGDRGRIQDGYKADLLLVDGDPGATIGATLDIVEVWKDGVPAASLRERRAADVAREKQPAQPASGAQPAAMPADGRISLFSAEKLASPIGAGWMPSNDSVVGGKSTTQLQVQALDADGQAALQVSAGVRPGFMFPWSGVAFMAGKKPMEAGDLSAYKTLSFKVKGDGKDYNVGFSVQGTYVPVNVAFKAEADWREINIAFAQLKGLDASIMTMIAFNAGSKHGDYQFQIKDVRLLK